MIRKLAGWAVLAFIAFYVLSDPVGAAHTVGGLLGDLAGAGHSLAAFANQRGTDMPTYIRPARVDITEDGGGGGLVPIAAAVLAVAAVVAFIAAHIVLLAVCAAVFVGVMGGLAVWFRWLSSPRRPQRHLQRPTVRVLPPRAAQAFPGPPVTKRQLARPWRVVSVERVPYPRSRVIEPARVNLTASRHVR
jgi:hypothetical protein